MALVNKDFASCHEYPVFLPKQSEHVVPIGFEFEFMCNNLTGLDKHPEIRDKGITSYLRSKFPKLYQFSGDCGFEAKSFVGPLSLHKSTLTKMGFFDLPHCLAKGGDNHAGIHTSIGICEFTIPVKEKIFSFLNSPLNEPLLRKLGGRPDNSFHHNCGPSARSGSWHYEYVEVDGYKDQRHKWFDTPNQKHWNRIINDSHEPSPGQRPVTTLPTFVRYDARGNELGRIEPVKPWNKGWWECRLFHGRPELLLPALELNDALVRLAHEGELTVDALYNYARGYPRYRDLAMLMAEQLQLGAQRKRGTHAPRSRPRTARNGSSGSRDASIGVGSVQSEEGFIDPIFPQVSALLAGRQDDDSDSAEGIQAA